MPNFIGIALGFAVALLARIGRLDRDRALYPSILIVIPFYYVVFAVVSQSRSR